MENFTIKYYKNTEANFKIAKGESNDTPSDEITTSGINDIKVSIVDNLLMRVMVPISYKVLDMKEIRVPNTKQLSPYIYSFSPVKQEYFNIQRISKLGKPDISEIGEIKSACIQKISKALPFELKLPDEFLLDSKPDSIWYIIRSADYLVENTKYVLTRANLLPSKTLLIPD